MDKQIILENIRKLDNRGWTLKSYRMWGSDKPCPPRLVVNPYKGCDFGHQYCYIGSCARPQEGFREHLQHKIEEAKKLELEQLLVIVSPSTDPFQPIERQQRDSLFALERLLENGFNVLVMSRNPQMLLEKEYSNVTRNPKLYIDVSIPSLQENNSSSVFYCAISQPINETFDAIKNLSMMGKYVRVKVEPVIPTINGIQGQTEKELSEIIRLSKETGVKKIISKTLRLNDDVPQYVRERLTDYYRANGHSEITTMALSEELRRKLLFPVFEACKKYEIPFCACVDSDVFYESTCGCSLNGK